VATNKRVTLPKKLTLTLGVDEGDFLLFWEQEGTIVVKAEKGYKTEKPAATSQTHSRKKTTE